MTEHFLSDDDPPSKKARKALRAHVHETLAKDAEWLARSGRQIVGIGGTMRNLAAAIQAQIGLPSLGGIQGFEIRRDDLDDAHRDLRRAARRRARRRQGHQVRARRPHPGRRDRRAGRARARRVRRDHGHRGRPARGRLLQPAPAWRPAAVRRRAPRRASRTSPRATRSAPRTPSTSPRSRSTLFDELAELDLHPGDRWERELLFCACVLHDIGMSVDYDDHHKHSRYLILNAGLPGFDPREVALVAQAARYHRKGMPNFGELAPLARRRRRRAPGPPVDPAQARRGPRAQPRPERARRAHRRRQRHDPPRARGGGNGVRRALGGAARGRALRPRVRQGAAGAERMSLTQGGGPLGRTTAQTNYTIESPAHKILFEPDARRLRAYVGDTLVLDSHRVHLLHETGIRPVPYVPLEDLDQTLLERHGPPRTARSRATRRTGRCASATTCARTPSGATRPRWSPRPGCRVRVALYADRVDRWLVEDEPVAGGLRDPYHRVDVHTSSRPVKVTAAGELIAAEHASDARLRDEPARARVPAAQRRRRRPPAPERHDDDRPVHRRRDLLAHPRGRRDAHRRRAQLRAAARRGDEDRRPGLLQRRGRRGRARRRLESG